MLSILPIRKKCPKCHREYTWNPETSQVLCPYCMGTGKPMKKPKNPLSKKQENIKNKK